MWIVQGINYQDFLPLINYRHDFINLSPLNRRKIKSILHVECRTLSVTAANATPRHCTGAETFTEKCRNTSPS